MEIEKPFRISLKLKEGKAPHLYLIQIKEMMKNDISLHPMMEKTLKLLKKTRTPYIMLATLREVVIDPANFRHFDRSAEPRGDWIITLWSEEEIKEHKENPEEHIKSILSFFEKIGYDLYDSKICNAEYIKMLEDITRSQLEAQLKQRSEEEFE